VGPKLINTRSIRYSLALISLFTLCGCAGFGDWARERGRDFGECWRGTLGLGAGLYAEAQVTSLLYPSVGFGDTTLTPQRAISWDPRPIPPGRTRTAAFPSLILFWPLYREEMRSMGYADTAPGWRGFLSPLIFQGSHHVERRSNSLLGLHRWLPNPLLEPPPEETPAARWSRRSWVAASGTLGFLHLDFGVNPLEIVDFLTGLFGWDLLEDDRKGVREAVEGDQTSQSAPDPLQ